MTHEDICGKDSWKVITSHLTDVIGGVYTVVRWCPRCGAIVVDEEFNGRTKPGSVRSIEFPQVFKMSGGQLP